MGITPEQFVENLKMNPDYPAISALIVKEYMRSIGKKGGMKGFAANPQLASLAGKKSALSRRKA